MDSEKPGRVKARITGTAVLADYPNGGRALVGIIDVDCPVCGQGQFAIPGHHMRTLMRQLAEWVEQFPDLTGTDQIETIDKTSFGGAPPKDVTRN